MSYTPSGAILSPCRLYRYLLWRVWDAPLQRTLLWIMLNPSTAAEDVDDATIRVCMGRARLLGYGGIVVANLFALRATNPTTLYSHGSPVSAYGDSGANDGCIYQALQRTHKVICAWGSHGKLQNRGRDMLSWLRVMGIGPMALKLNRDGSPAHPLRIPYSQPLVRI
jgi:hypothetical protein